MGMQKFGHLVRMLQSRAFCSRQIPAAQVTATQDMTCLDVLAYGTIILFAGAPVFYYILFWNDRLGVRTKYMAIKAAEKELERKGRKDNSVPH